LNHREHGEHGEEPRMNALANMRRTPFASLMQFSVLSVFSVVQDFQDRRLPTRHQR